MKPEPELVYVGELEGYRLYLQAPQKIAEALARAAAKMALEEMQNPAVSTSGAERERYEYTRVESARR